MAVETKPGAVPQPGQPNQPNQPAQPKPAAAQQPAEQPRQGGSSQNEDSDAGGDLRAALQESYRLRTEVPGHPDVDARLDNRQGRFRPPVEEWPAKPQQVDGPDLPGQAEHTRRTLQDLTDDGGDRKGMYSPGPHGLSDESLRESGTAFGPEGLADAGPGSKD